jgi:hypothetical protein
VSTDTVAVQLVTPSGVPPVFGSVLDSLAKYAWLATVLCNDRCAASQDGAQGSPDCPDLFWHRVQSTGYLYSTPLRSGCRAVEGPHSLLSGPDLRTETPPARVGCIDTGSTSNHERCRKMTDVGTTVARSVCRKTVQRRQAGCIGSQDWMRNTSRQRTRYHAAR